MIERLREDADRPDRDRVAFRRLDDDRLLAYAVRREDRNLRLIDDRRRDQGAERAVVAERIRAAGQIVGLQPPLPGSARVWKVNIGGVTREFDTRITEQHPDQRIAWTTTEGQKHAGVVTFHKLTDTSTRVTLQMEYDPERLTENVGDKVGVVSRRVEGDMERFKQFIEERLTPTGAWRGEIDR